MKTRTHEAQSRSQQTLEAILRCHAQRQTRAMRIDSPPGAGKTWLVQRLALCSLRLLEERVLVVVQTNAQAHDLLTRLAQDFPQVKDFHWLQSQSYRNSAVHHSIEGVHCHTKPDELPCGPSVVVTTAAKAMWLPTKHEGFEVLIVDEAFQLTDARFHTIASLGQRLVLVGDPGQIAPVIKADTVRWRGLAKGPDQPCPEALATRYPTLTTFRLPVSRRLPQDTVSIVQPAFYPAHPFDALAQPDERGLYFAHTAQSQSTSQPHTLAAPSWTSLRTQLASGQSLLQVQYPGGSTTPVDLTVVEGMCATIKALLAAPPTLKLDGQERPLEARDIGVICPHVGQVTALQQRLHAFPAIYVETCDRFQGLQRPLTLVYHPMIGCAQADDFHLDLGRMCVALSRHQVACLLFTREAIQHTLDNQASTSERTLEHQDHTPPRLDQPSPRAIHSTLLTTIPCHVPSPQFLPS